MKAKQEKKFNKELGWIPLNEKDGRENFLQTFYYCIVAFATAEL